MRLVVQRVKRASVEVDGRMVGQIQHGLLVFLGIHREDQPADTAWLVNKLVNLRIFEDDAGKMNLSLKDVNGQALIVSQFTLYGNCVNGRRPDFLASAPAAQAEPIYLKFAAEVAKEIAVVQTGIFGASMQISLLNDGPVTLIIDGQK